MWRFIARLFNRFIAYARSPLDTSPVADDEWKSDDAMWKSMGGGR